MKSVLWLSSFTSACTFSVVRQVGEHGSCQRDARCPEDHVQRREEGQKASSHQAKLQGGDQVPPSDDEAR